MAIEWNIIHRGVTESTNDDAASGVHGDVFTADYQLSGRGRIGHKWQSPSKTNLLMSVVLDVSDMEMEELCTFPLVVGLSVAKSIRNILGEQRDVKLKWPNDILIDGLKVAGILCERKSDMVIAGIGINVLKQDFPAEISLSATYLGNGVKIEQIRDSVLNSLSLHYTKWRESGFSSFWEDITEIDFLKGREVAVLQVDEDVNPMTGLCGGILLDGSLQVGAHRVYAGEVHVKYQ